VPVRHTQCARPILVFCRNLQQLNDRHPTACSKHLSYPYPLSSRHIMLQSLLAVSTFSNAASCSFTPSSFFFFVPSNAHGSVLAYFIHPLTTSSSHPITATSVPKNGTQHHIYVLHINNVVKRRPWCQLIHERDPVRWPFPMCYDTSIDSSSTPTIAALFSNSFNSLGTQTLLQLCRIYPAFHRHRPASTLPPKTAAHATSFSYPPSSPSRRPYKFPLVQPKLRTQGCLSFSLKLKLHTCCVSSGIKPQKIVTVPNNVHVWCNFPLV